MVRAQHKWALLVVTCLVLQVFMYYDTTPRAGPAVRLEDLAGAPSTLPSTLPPPPSPPPPPPPPPPRAAAAATVAADSAAPAASAAAPSCGALPPLVAFEAAAAQVRARCELVVATAVFEGAWLLRQPKHCGDGAARRLRDAQAQAGGTAEACHVAFVDWPSERMLKQRHKDELYRKEDGSVAYVGCWQLLPLGGGLPMAHAAANEVAAQLLLPLLFPNAAASVWVDAARQLRVREPQALAARALAPPLLLALRAAAEPPPAAGGAPSRWRRVAADGAPEGAAAPPAATALDATVVLRAHAPAAAARALACGWWTAWARRAAAPLSPAAAGDAEAAEAATRAHTAAALAEVGADGGGGGGLGLFAPSTELVTTTRAKRRNALVSPEPPPAALTDRRAVGARAEVVRHAALRPLGFAARGGGGGFAGGAHGPSDGEREANLALRPAAAGGVTCGFLQRSAFDDAAALLAQADCDVVVLTSIFEAYDKLVQPKEDVQLSDAERRCFFALVDRPSYTLLLHENGVTPPAASGLPSSLRELPVVGVWRLLLLDGPLPFDSARRNSRVPKLLTHRLFPPPSRATKALWLDSKLQLLRPPRDIARRFLGGGAVFGAYRNFKRDHIDEERDWIWKHKCVEDVGKCAELMRQWAAYEAAEASPRWTEETVAIEGCLLLFDLRSPLANALQCNWFNEYVRYGERDQISLAYVLLRMGLAAGGANASAALRLIPRTMHYLTKPSARALQIVQKVGHRSGTRRIH